MSSQEDDTAGSPTLHSNTEATQKDAPCVARAGMQTAWFSMSDYQKDRLAAAGINSFTSPQQLLAIYVYLLRVKHHRHVEARPELLNICCGLAWKKA